MKIVEDRQQWDDIVKVKEKNKGVNLKFYIRKTIL
jgi:hypothetical protein